MLDPRDLYAAVSKNLNPISMSLLSQSNYKAHMKYLAEQLEQNSIEADAKAEIEAWSELNLPYFSKLVKESRYAFIYPFLIMGIIKGQQEQKIEKARYTELKELLSHLIDDVFNTAYRQLQNEFGRNEIDNITDVSSLIVFHRPNNLHEIASSYKKFTVLNAKTENAPILRNLTCLLDEAMVFNLANNELKALITATVRKKAVPPPENQGDLFTCSYCFRSIRLQNPQATTIAYHGFQRFEGMQSASCKGSWFKPFEVSCNGAMQCLQDLANLSKIRSDQLIKLRDSLSRIKMTDDEGYSKIARSIQENEFMIEKQIPNKQNYILNRIKSAYPDLYEEAKSIVQQVAGTNAQ